MNQKTVYLAGPITGLTYDEGQDWRNAATIQLRSHGIKALSPLRNKEFLRTLGTLEDNHNHHPLSADKGIVCRDRNDVRTCDAVLMNLLGATRISLGTMIEVGWADAYRKPVVLVMEESGNVHEHSMLRELVGYRVSSLEQALYITTTLMGADL